MAKICRTCAQIIINNDYFYLDGCSYVSTNMQVYGLLQNCIPEFEFEMIPNSVICKNCMSAAHIAYYFIQEAIKNERVFRSKQRIRVKNFEDLTGNSVEDLNDTDEREDKKVSAFELELADANDLKVELVYEDADDNIGNVEEQNNDDKNVQINEDQEYEFFHDEDNDEDVHCSPIVLYDQYNLLESIQCEDTLQLQDENFQTESPDQMCDLDNITVEEQKSSDCCESTVDDNSASIEGEESKSNLNVTSFIQRTSCSTRKIRHVQRPYKCSDCSFRTDAKASLIMHQRIHTGEKPFCCTICTYRAKRKAHLDDHMRIHTGDRPYSCPTCGKCFITKQIMKKHARIHTGEKPYQCKRCNFKSRHKMSIANHVKKVHIGVIKLSEGEPSVCYICGKYLSGPASLSTHMRIHTGVKSHLCELCGRYFREKGMLKNHLQTHTGEKPFKCFQCDYIATRKAHLKDHMKTHVGITELVECTQCDKRYATKILLKKHMKEEHTTEVVAD